MRYDDLRWYFSAICKVRRTDTLFGTRLFWWGTASTRQQPLRHILTTLYNILLTAPQLICRHLAAPPLPASMQLRCALIENHNACGELSIPQQDDAVTLLRLFCVQIPKITSPDPCQSSTQSIESAPFPNLLPALAVWLS